MDPVTVLAQSGGTASWRELTASCTRWAVRRALEAGSIHRVRRDCYVLAGLEEAPRRALAAGGVLAGLSAAVHHGWKVKGAPARPCVLLPPNRRKPGGDLELHWGDAPARDVVGGVTARARTVADCGRWLPFDEALAVADSAMRGGMTRASLRRAVRRLPRNGRERAMRVVEAADGRADNPFESVTRAISLGVEGIALVPQVRVPGVGRVDLADRALGVIVECESFTHHAEPDAFAADVRRYTALVRQGWSVIRIGWHDAMHRPEYVAAVLADVVRLATRKEACPACIPAAA